MASKENVWDDGVTIGKVAVNKSSKMLALGKLVGQDGNEVEMKFPPQSPVDQGVDQGSILALSPLMGPLENSF